MDVKRLRHRCEALLRELDLPAPFDIRAFRDALARQRSRPIVLEPASMEQGHYGLWLALPEADVIFYEQDTSPLHQEHIILHEVCHLLCGHAPVSAADSAAVLALAPELRPAAVQHMLQRASYSTEEECEAELLASLILERTEQTRVGLSRTTALLPERLEAVLEEGPGAKA